MSETIKLSPSTSITGYETLDEMKRETAGRLMLVARPLVANVPDMQGATKVTCHCGRECWKRDLEPDPLPEYMIGVCTACALMRRVPNA